MTLNQKCAVMVVVPLAAVVGLVAVGTWTLQKANAGLDDVVNRQFVRLVEDEITPLIAEKMLPVIEQDLVLIQQLDQSLQLMLEADRDMHQALIAERAALTASGEALAAADGVNAENIAQAAKRVDKAAAHFRTEQTRALHAQFQNQFAAWRTETRNIIAQVADESQRTVATAASLGGSAQVAFDTARDSLDKLQGLQQQEIDATLAEIARKKQEINESHTAVEQQKTGVVAVSREIMDGTAMATRLFVIIGAATIIVVPIIGFLIARGLSRALKRVVAELTAGAGQVNAAAAQIAGGSQQIAQGASNQASALEETSASLEELAASTRTNAATAEQANQLAAQARGNAETGDRTMGELNHAMENINDASNQISRIIKVIEEIAFQTNLLALNAAVEAARAGEHGKGFAVVAEEVRNLARRAADAARETTTLIEGSVSRAQAGTQVANAAAQCLQSIVGDVSQVADLLTGIARASGEQADGVEQINRAVSEMDKTTQQNAAGAEESASASEQLRAQAQALGGIVSELGTLVGQGRAETGPAAK